MTQWNYNVIGTQTTLRLESHAATERYLTVKFSFAQKQLHIPLLPNVSQNLGKYYISLVNSISLIWQGNYTGH